MSDNVPECDFSHRGKKIGQGSFNNAYQYINNDNSIIIDREYISSNEKKEGEQESRLDKEIQESLSQIRNVTDILQSDPSLEYIINKCDIRDPEKNILCMHNDTFHTIFTCPRMGTTFWSVITTMQQDQEANKVYIIVLYIILMQMIRILNEKNIVHGDPTLANIMFGQGKTIRNIKYAIETKRLYKWVSNLLQFPSSEDQYEQELKGMFDTYKNDIMEIVDALQIKWIDLDTLTRLENPTIYERMIDVAIAYQSMFSHHFIPNIKNLVADIMTIQMFSLNTGNQDQEWILYILELGQFYDTRNPLTITQTTLKPQYIGYFRNTDKLEPEFRAATRNAKLQHDLLTIRRNIKNSTRVQKNNLIGQTLNFGPDEDGEDDEDNEDNEDDEDYPRAKRQRTELPNTEKNKWLSFDGNSDDLLAKETLQSIK
jgi:hypothetical protein